MMTWIKTIPFDQASGKLKRLYDRIVGPDDNVDNIMMAHSLRPHTMEGHMALYKYTLHHSANTVPKWFLEVLGVWVSILNRCDYCRDHHFAGAKRLIGDDAIADAMYDALQREDSVADVFSASQQAALSYARKLTQSPMMLTQEDVGDLRNVGFDDGEILEINQVVSYFAYANRTVLGLGCSTAGDIIGLSPGNSDDPEDWSHR